MITPILAVEFILKSFLLEHFLTEFARAMESLLDIPLSRAKIVGGTYAQPGEFPYQLELVKKDGGSHICGAALISSMLALTAAHCVYTSNETTINVVAGEHRRGHIDETEQIRGIQEVLIHENIKSWSDVDENDIALLVVSEEFELNRHTSPVIIPTEKTKLRNVAISVGWGTTVDGKRNNSQILKKATIPLLPKEKCTEMYTRLGKIAEKTICAGGLGAGSCHGDSGGALTCIGQNGKKYLCGLVSWGRHCSNKYPVVYADVSKYADWIEEKISDLRARNICAPASPQCEVNYASTAGASARLENPCSDNEFYCLINKNCIPLSFQCDQDLDCGFGDSSDEINCPVNELDDISRELLTDAFTLSPGRECLPHEFHCNKTKLCLPQQFLCDGEPDCGLDDESDEGNCDISASTPSNEFFRDAIAPSSSCEPGYFQCNLTKTCIPLTSLCDSTYDCGIILDYSDEEDCGWNIIPLNISDIYMSYGMYRSFGINPNECGIDRFRCRKSKLCVSKVHVCNFSHQCAILDDSDEASDICR